MTEERHDYLTEAARHYGALFTFPTYPTLVGLLIVSALLCSMTAFYVVIRSPNGLIRGAAFGLSALALPTICVDVIASRLVTAKDVILDLRRLTALSFLTIASWGLIIIVGAIIQVTLGIQGLICGAFFGISSAVSLRFLVVRSVTRLSPSRVAILSVLHPGIYLTILSIVWLPNQPYLFLATTVSTLMFVLATSVLIFLVNRDGMSKVSVGSIDLFQAFLANWLGGLTSPLEEYFEQMGTEADASVSLFAFRTYNTTQGIIVIPNIHPGPFKNLGSSNIPWMIQVALEKGIFGTVMVPHGTSGHEFDLTSQRYNKKTIEAITELADFSDFSIEATPMVRAELGDAKATCQFFGGVALVVLTCAPASMEDIPPEVGAGIIERGRAIGARDVAVIDAHNSIGSAKEIPILSTEQLDALKAAAETAIADALRKERGPFRFGASRVIPSEFGVREGLGPGGIAAAIVVMENQTVAYVTIDGNNMIRGLREEILAAIKDLVDDAEVLTTDTHIVNAVSTIERGYHPVGETMDHIRLKQYVRDCISTAVKGAGVSSVAFRRGLICRVRVIGEAKLKRLSLLVDSSVKLTTCLLALIYVPTVLASILVFTFFL